MTTTDNLNDSGNHLRQHADIRNEPELPRENEVTEMIDFIASFCTDPDDLSIVRRAARNLYNVGRTHEAIDAVAQMERLKLKLVQL